MGRRRGGGWAGLRRAVGIGAILGLVAGCTAPDDPLWSALAGEPLPGWPVEAEEEEEEAPAAIPIRPVRIPRTGGFLGPMTPLLRTEPIRPPTAGSPAASPATQPVAPAVPAPTVVPRTQPAPAPTVPAETAAPVDGEEAAPAVEPLRRWPILGRS